LRSSDTTGDALERRLKRFRTDADTRLVFADWLEEHGEEDRARAQRWLARAGKHLLAQRRERSNGQPKGTHACWRTDTFTFGEPFIATVLPHALWLRLAEAVDYTGVRRWYRTEADAERDLGRALNGYEEGAPPATSP
jgi:uncharacterized protein (TIGR02996 family)